MSETLTPYGPTHRMIEVNLKNQRPCPFCGSKDLLVTDWADDNGEYLAIECNSCYGCAPAETWNKRYISL